MNLRYLTYLKYLFYKRYPAEITFFVTARCNFRCLHCFNIEKIKKGDFQNELSLSEIEKISKTIPEFMRLSLSGGEPFLREDLAEICRLFYKNCRVGFISIPTNASLPEKIAQDAEKIVRFCPDLFLSISLSLDGLGKQRDDIVGRTNTEELLLQTARKINLLKGKYPNLGIGSITTQIPKNENQLDEIHQFALKRLLVDNFGFNIARMTEGKMASPSLRIYQDFTQRLAKRKQPLFKFFLSRLVAAKKALVFKQVLRTNRQGRYLRPCFSGNLRVVIDELGNVYPCETLQYARNNQKFLMGSLRDYNLNFKKLFFSQQAQEIKSKIRKTKCFCAHECDLETNILFNPGSVPELIIQALRLKFGNRA